jgi:hypothetical protein
MSTQLTSSSGYNTKNMIFSEPAVSSIPDSKPPIKFTRINISTKYPNGKTGDLIFPTVGKIFSFGVSESINKDTGVVNGYSMALCLLPRDEEPSDEQKEFIATYDAVANKCKEYLIEKRDAIGKYELEMGDLKKLNNIYIKKEKGVPVPGSSPTLYPKLIVSKKQDKILTYFFDEDDNPLNALDLIGKYCHVNAAIKIESIFIGKDISLQVKLYECQVSLLNTGMTRLLAKSSRPESNPIVKDMSKTTNALPDLSDDKDDDDVGSLVDSDKDDEEYTEPEPVKEEPKKVVKRVVKKVVKKGE